MDQMTKPQLRFSKDKPTECEYCYYWGGMRKGCTLGGEKHCAYTIREKKPKQKSRCIGCPYGRDSPCIGWCTVDVMNAVFKGRNKSDAGSSTKEVSDRCR